MIVVAFNGSARRDGNAASLVKRVFAGWKRSASKPNGSSYLMAIMDKLGDNMAWLL